MFAIGSLLSHSCRSVFIHMLILSSQKQIFSSEFTLRTAAWFYPFFFYAKTVKYFHFSWISPRNEASALEVKIRDKKFLFDTLRNMTLTLLLFHSLLLEQTVASCSERRWLPHLIFFDPLFLGQTVTCSEQRWPLVKSSLILFNQGKLPPGVRNKDDLLYNPLRFSLIRANYLVFRTKMTFCIILFDSLLLEQTVASCSEQRWPLV
jgi:hypothetical protein